MVVVPFLPWASRNHPLNLFQVLSLAGAPPASAVLSMALGVAAMIVGFGHEVSGESQRRIALSVAVGVAALGTAGGFVLSALVEPVGLSLGLSPATSVLSGAEVLFCAAAALAPAQWLHERDRSRQPPWWRRGWSD